MQRLQFSLSVLFIYTISLSHATCACKREQAQPLVRLRAEGDTPVVTGQYGNFAGWLFSTQPLRWHPLELLRARGIHSIDNEISYMAEVAPKADGRQAFGCIHILTDYLYSKEEREEMLALKASIAKKEAAANADPIKVQELDTLKSKLRNLHDLASEDSERKKAVKRRAMQAMASYVTGYGLLPK